MGDIYNEYDKVVANCLSDIMQNFKNKNKIIINDFYSEIAPHRFAFNIIEIAANILNKKIYINCSPFKYWDFRKKYLTTAQVKWRLCWRKNSANAISIQRWVDNISHELNLTDELLTDIYNAYYNNDIKHYGDLND